MTLLARDEADIVDEQIKFHLNAGADFVIATDNLSQDGTTDILESYAKQRQLHLISEDGEYLRQADWITRMGRMAATEFGADWVIHSDADEFWWPRGDSLKDVLASIPARYGIVRALLRHFVPRPDDGAPFAERMTVRVSASSPINDPRSLFRPNLKIIHRADPNVSVSIGAQRLIDSPLDSAARLVSDRVLPLSSAKPRAVRAEVRVPADRAGPDSQPVLRPCTCAHRRGSRQ